MGLLFETTLPDVGLIAACLLAVVYIYFKVSFNYWKERKAPYVAPTFPFGNFSDLILMRKPVGQVYADLYKKLDGEKYGGTYMFTKPGFIFRDPEIIKDVLVKDFSSFHDRGVYIDEELEPLSGHLVFLSGIRWRNLRVKLTPIFTSGKMKMMFQTLVDCGQQLGSILEDCASDEETIEIKDILARYSTDIISSCAFGIESNSLKNPDAEFRQWGRKIFDLSILSSAVRNLNLLIPSFKRVMKLRGIDPEIAKYFISMVQDTVNFRQEKNIKRNDFMQMLIQIRNRDRVEDDHCYVEQNCHGHSDNKSDDNGMCLAEYFREHTHISPCFSIDELKMSIGSIIESDPHISVKGILYRALRGPS
jgi:cytochrome P450 family 6